MKPRASFSGTDHIFVGIISLQLVRYLILVTGDSKEKPAKYSALKKINRAEYRCEEQTVWGPKTENGLVSTYIHFEYQIGKRT